MVAASLALKGSLWITGTVACRLMKGGVGGRGEVVATKACARHCKGEPAA